MSQGSEEEEKEKREPFEAMKGMERKFFEKAKLAPLNLPSKDVSSLESIVNRCLGTYKTE